MWTIEKAELIGNDAVVTLTRIVDGKVENEGLTWGRNKNEAANALKARIKLSLAEALAVRNPTTPLKTVINVAELT